MTGIQLVVQSGQKGASPEVGLGDGDAVIFLLANHQHSLYRVATP